jgi:hypothetical protein
LKKVLILVVLALLSVPTEAQYRARWSVPPGSSVGGTPTIPPVATELLSSSDTNEAASYTTTGSGFVEHFGAPTFSCPTGSLCLAWVTSTDGDAPDGPDVPATFTQTGQTWELLNSVMESSAVIRQSLYYTVGVGASPAALAVTFSDGDTQSGIAFLVWEVENVDTTAGTSGIVRFNSGSGANAGSAMTTSGTYTMSVSLPDRNTGSALLMGHGNQQTCTTRTAKAGYTEGTAAAYAGPNVRARVDYVVGGSDTSPAVLLTGPCSQSTIDWVGIAVELAPDTSVDATLPTVIITSPTIGETWNSSDAAFNFGGSAADDDAVASVTWACPTCTPTSGTATGTTSWSASTTIARSGGGTANVITVTAEDASSNSSTDVITVTGFSTDTIAPIVTVINPATSPSTSSNPLITLDGTITDNVAVDRVDYTAVGATPSSGTASLLAGEWNFTLTVPCSAGGTSTTVNMTGYDVAGNPSVVHTRVRVCVSSGDVTAPTVTVTGNCGGGAGANCSVTSANATFTGTASDNVALALVTYTCATCTPSSGSTTSASTWTFTGISLAPGANTLCAVATDTAGNQSASDCQTWTYTAPLAITTGSCPPAQEDVAYGACTIQYSGGDGGATWSQVGSSLNTGSCAGLTLAQVGQNAVVDGTPTAAAPTTCTFTLEVDDGDEQVEREFAITIVATGTGPHAYYEQLLALPEAVPSASRTLRSQSQLNSFTGTTEISGTTPWAPGSSTNTPWWTYDPGIDTHPETQDAGKLYIPRLRGAYDCLTIRGKVTFTGTPATVIPANTRLVNPVTGYEYRAESSSTIAANGVTGEVNILAVTPVGELYKAEIVAGTVLDFVTPISGVDTTAKVAPSEDVKVRCASAILSPDMLKIPMGLGGPTMTSADSIIYTWDVYYTHEWRLIAERLEWSQLKAFKPHFGATQFDPTVGWTWFVDFRASRDLLSANPKNFAAHSVFPYGGDNRVKYGFTVPYKNMSPTGQGAYGDNEYQFHWGVWTRYWIEIKFAQPGTAFTEWGDLVCAEPLPLYCSGVSGTLLPNPNKVDGTYMMISIWAADEERNAEVLLYRVPYQGSQTWLGTHVMEFGVSDTGITVSEDLTAYIRNLGVLQNYTLGPNAHLTDAVLFQRPVR